jgi:hypothetical protein
MVVVEEPSWFDKDLDDFDITMDKMTDSESDESEGNVLILYKLNQFMEHSTR